MPIKRAPRRKPLKASALTAPGEGGISIVALWGPGAARFAAAHLRGKNDARPALRAGRLAYGFFCNSKGEPLDEVIVACASPRKIEINCHGGALSTRRVLSCLAEEGVTVERATFPPEPQRIRSAVEKEALEALFASHTPLAARVFAAQAGGLLENALRQAVDHVESGRIDEAENLLSSLTDGSVLGLALAEPRVVAVVGPTNAGKSTLVNAIVGYERSIVTDVPGTTRDAIRVPAAVHGVPLVFVDTAGAAAARTSLDERAQEHAVQAGERADLMLVVIDRAAPLPVGYAPPKRTGPAIAAANKSDLPVLAETARAVYDWDIEAVDTSGKTGDGVAQLADRILAALGIARPQDDVALRPIIFTARQKECVDDALEFLRGGDPACCAASLRECIGDR